jgi:Protein of unknown function (DUF2442)
MTEPRLSEDELLRQIESAREADRIADLTEPRARDAYYDIRTGRIVVELKTGGAFAFPPSLLPELRDRAPADLARVQVSPSGEGIYWDELDLHIETAGVLVEMLGPSMFRAFASVGGRARTERKAAAARANGAKGGRPRKQPDQGVRYRPDPNLGVMKVAEVYHPPRPRTNPGASSHPASGEADPE